MENLKCIRAVQDKHTGKAYVVGEVYGFETDRAAELVASIYFEPVEAEPTEPGGEPDENSATEPQNSSPSEPTVTENKPKTSKTAPKKK